MSHQVTRREQVEAARRRLRERRRREDVAAQETQERLDLQKASEHEDIPMGALHFDIRVSSWHHQLPGLGDGQPPGWNALPESFGVCAVPATAKYDLERLKKIEPKRRRELVEELAVALDYILQHLEDE